LQYVTYKDRKDLAGDLRPIYQASTEDEALQHLADFAPKWDLKYPQFAKSWYNNWA
jgi:putative transposase